MVVPNALESELDGIASGASGGRRGIETGDGVDDTAGAAGGETPGPGAREGVAELVVDGGGRELLLAACGQGWAGG